MYPVQSENVHDPRLDTRIEWNATRIEWNATRNGRIPDALLRRKCTPWKAKMYSAVVI